MRPSPSDDSTPMPQGELPPFEVEVSGSGPVTTVSARGELDLATVPQLREVLAHQHGPVVLDLRDLSFIDVSGLHLLLEADARARRDGLDLMLVPGPGADRLLRLLEVRDCFCIKSPGG